MKFEFLDYLILFGSGMMGFAIRYVQGKVKNFNIIVLNFLIVLSIVFIIIPAITEYYEFSIRILTVIVWLFSMFNDKLMSYLEDKFSLTLKNDLEKSKKDGND